MAFNIWWAFMMVAAAFAAFVVGSAVELLWLRPRRLERGLRCQGIIGSSYRFPLGDVRDDAKLFHDARRNPIPLSHRIVPRVAPQLHLAWELYGGESKVLFTWMGPYPQIMIMDPEMVKEVLSTKFGNFEKPQTNPFVNYVISGVGSYDGEKWAKHRRIIGPAFHVEKLKMMIPAFSTCCDELISRWEDYTGTRGVCELDVWPEFQIFAGDIISRAAFGNSYKDGRRIFELQLEQIDLLVQSFQSLYIPGLRFIPTRKNKRRKEIHREVITLLKSMIEQRELAIRNGESNSADLLSLLIESNLRYFQEQGERSPHAGLTTEDVIDECKVFYFAGHETASILLTWTLIVLSMHQNWQARAREEVMKVFGQNKPNIEGLNELKILTMILLEVLRLYPLATWLVRKTCKETKLGKFVFPAGVLVALPIILLHHSRKYWGEDAEEFNPERFAEGVSKATKNQLVFFPFGWGPRICLGQSFALTEVKLVLARILQRFSAELSPSYAHEPCLVLTLQPQNGAQLILKKL